MFSYKYSNDLSLALPEVGVCLSVGVSVIV
jgi:hypothetical protein